MIFQKSLSNCVKQSNLNIDKNNPDYDFCYNRAATMWVCDLPSSVCGFISRVKKTHTCTKRDKNAFILLYNIPPQLFHFTFYLEHLAAYLEQLPFECLCITVIISSLRKEWAIQLAFSLPLADIRLLIGTRPVLSCTYLQFPRLIPFYCSHASITGNTPTACACSAAQTQPLRPMMAVLPYMLPQNCRRDECGIKNNVTRIQTDHNKYLHRCLLNAVQTLVCVEREKERVLIMTRIFL